ncbi:hypothetical protein KAU45_03615 [bacterium]|nr:hypothetical protein [bacterium]
MVASATILGSIFPGCLREEPQISTDEQPRTYQDSTWPVEPMQYPLSSLDRIEKRLKGSSYPLIPIANPDPNQYGANGGRALRCDVVGVDLLFWTYDDQETARRAGELWEEKVNLPLRWTVSENLLLVLFADDDFAGVSEEVAEELMASFAGARGG